MAHLRKLAVALAVALERVAAAVIGITIDLDDEACFAPHEVDLETPEGRVDFGVLQACSAHETQEQLFGIRAGHRRAAATVTLLRRGATTRHSTQPGGPLPT